MPQPPRPVTELLETLITETRKNRGAVEDLQRTYVVFLMIAVAVVCTIMFVVTRK